jgi:hypothetical protein
MPLVTATVNNQERASLDFPTMGSNRNKPIHAQLGRLIPELGTDIPVYRLSWIAESPSHEVVETTWEIRWTPGSSAGHAGWTSGHHPWFGT